MREGRRLCPCVSILPEAHSQERQRGVSPRIFRRSGARTPGPHPTGERRSPGPCRDHAWRDGLPEPSPERSAGPSDPEGHKIRADLDSALQCSKPGGGGGTLPGHALACVCNALSFQAPRESRPLASSSLGSHRPALPMSPLSAEEVAAFQRLGNIWPQRDPGNLTSELAEARSRWPT